MFEGRIAESLTGTMRALAPRLQRLRAAAEGGWQDLQRPPDLAPGLWLHVQPLALALAPLQGTAARVETAVSLAFRAALFADARPGGTPTPLPALVPYRPAEPGMRMVLGLELDYPRLSAALSAQLRGQTLELSGRRAEITALDLTTQGENLVVSATLSGDLPGRLTIMPRPAFDATTQALRLQ